MSTETNETAPKPTPRDEAAPAFRAGPGIGLNIKGILGRSGAVGLGAGTLTTLAALVINPTGPAAKLGGFIGIMLGAANGTAEIITKARRQRLLDAAEGRRAMLEAESDENYRLLLEARRMLADCERDKADLIHRLEALEHSCLALQADMRDMQVAFQGERRELMADLRAARGSVREMGNEAFRRDSPPERPTQ